jgi:hypothetical protein
MTKSSFIQDAKNYGVGATYSGTTNTMFVKGDDAKVKSFIRVVNLKGKEARKFKLAQA